ncbi:MAG TPA: extracellular solute-binding protein [Bacillota bacterium]|nr:extracellular solute-binding protein [Bacillota bacterium]
MKPITRRTALGLGAAAVAAPLLASCGGAGSDSETQDKIDNPDANINKTGMPIVKESITLHMMTRHRPSTADDWNTVKSVKKLEELTNIKVDWGPVPWEGAAEKRNLALASGDYPAILNRTAVSAVDLAKYGEQGTFIALNELIDEYMPNLKGVMDKYPDIAKGMTMPDGNIYSMPTIYDPAFDSLMMQQKLWIRKDWLDDFGMSEPETLEEFEAFLTEVKGKNPVKKGSPAAIPFTDGSAIGWLVQMFWGAFGIGTRGEAANPLDADPSGALRFFPTSEEYKEHLTFLNKLYSKGLIQSDVFSNDSAKFNTLGKQGLVGAAAMQAPIASFGQEEGEKYVALGPLKRSSGDEVPTWNPVGSGLASMGQFVLTDKSTHPIETARWIDYRYGDEGSRLFFMGIEGESYEETGDGQYEFTDEITDNPDGLTVDEALKPYVTYLGGSYAGIVKEAYFKGTESSPQAREGAEKIAPYRIEEVWPDFTYTSDEAAELSSLTVDLDKLRTEARDTFINGKKSLKEWNNYLEDFDRIGLSRYMEIQQAAYDRYTG